VVGAASGAGIAIGAYFAFYGAACNTLSVHCPDMPASAVAFVAGAAAAVGSSAVKVPLAVCIRSVQAGVYPNVLAAARSITAAAGPRGLFTGWLPTLLEDVPDMAIKFAAYETMRQVCAHAAILLWRWH
jgi:solute carrier family 25 (mitochondrial S-adenosylmethionine transporter), member 26